jgi:hypothetical protein
MLNDGSQDNPLLSATKKKVKRLHKEIKALLPDFPLGHCYDMWARTHRYKDWHVMRDALNAQYQKRTIGGGIE